MNESIIKIVIGFVVIVLPIVLSLILGGLFTKVNKGERLPYTWGFYIAISVITFYGLLLISTTLELLGLLHEEQPHSYSEMFFALLLFGGFLISGCYCIRRYKWAWVVSTIITFIPIYWIINYFYGRKRWREFR